MSKLSDFKALLFDVDGTLTNSQSYVSERTKQALKNLALKGISIGVCTGRNLSVLQKIFLLFPSESLHVVAGGGQVVSSTNEVMWEKLISGTTVQAIIEKAKIFDAAFLVNKSDVAYVNQKMRTYLKKKHNLGTLKLRPIEELTDFACPIIPAFDIKDEFLNYLTNRDDITFKLVTNNQFHTSNTDITAHHVTKAFGLKEFCRLQNIQLSEVIGVGDSENDDEFLETVGFSVAMGNATPYLKSIAKRTVGHTDEDGLAVYLEGLLKGAEL